MYGLGVLHTVYMMDSTRPGNNISALPGKESWQGRRRGYCALTTHQCPNAVVHYPVESCSDTMY